MLNARVLDTTVASLLLDRSPLLALYQPYLVGAPLLTHDTDFSPDAVPSITVYCHA